MITIKAFLRRRILRGCAAYGKFIAGHMPRRDRFRYRIRWIANGLRLCNFIGLMAKNRFARPE